MARSARVETAGLYKIAAVQAYDMKQAVKLPQKWEARREALEREGLIGALQSRASASGRRMLLMHARRQHDSPCILGHSWQPQVLFQDYDALGRTWCCT